MENINTVCEHCGTPIKHSYVITNNDTHFRVGTTCFKKYSNLSKASVAWLEKKFQDIKQMQDKKSMLEIALTSEDEEEMLEVMKINKIHWMFNYDDVVSATKGWIETYELRIDSVQNEIDGKTVKTNIIVK